MDPALYYEIYRDGIDKKVILRYAGYIKSHYFYCLTEDYIWRVKPEVKN